MKKAINNDSDISTKDLAVLAFIIYFLLLVTFTILFFFTEYPTRLSVRSFMPISESKSIITVSGPATILIKPGDVLFLDDRTANSDQCAFSVQSIKRISRSYTTELTLTSRCKDKNFSDLNNNVTSYVQLKTRKRRMIEVLFFAKL